MYLPQYGILLIRKLGISVVRSHLFQPKISNITSNQKFEKKIKLR